MFEWDEAKNKQLKEERNITFEEIVEAIAKDQILGIEENENYPNQSILAIKIKNYVYAVVIEERKDKTRLITAFQSRKLNKKYGDK